MRSLVIGVVLVVSSLVRAEEPPCASCNEAAPLSDDALSAAENRQVELVLHDGRVTGTLVSWDALRVIIVESNPKRTTELARRDIESVRVLDAVSPLSMRAPEPKPVAEKKRYFGISGGFGLGNLVLDVHASHFYAFAATSIGFPILWAAGPPGNHPGHYFGFVVGAGPSWKLAPTSRWRFDLFAMLIPAWWSQYSTGIGVGIGFHYTAPNGLTVGIKLPIFGGGPGCNQAYGGIGEPQDFACAKLYTPGLVILNFFANAGMQMPVVSLGYRF